MVVNLDAVFAGFTQVRESFSPGNGQTLFNLTLGTPAVPADTVMVINQVDYREGAAGGNHFTVSGTVVTWTDIFQFEVADSLEIVYFIP